MKRVLLGWEIGENRGHILRLGELAGRLRRQGCEIAWAVSRLDLLAGFAQPGEQVFQAPIWPGLHLDVAMNARSGPARSYADVLCALGLGSAGAFAQMLRAWDGILAAVRPAAVFADFAPALLGACRGRVPVVTAGIGFAVPPAQLARFPRFDRLHTGADAPNDGDEEAALLAEANRGLDAIGRPALPALPAIFAADATIVAAFRELDPYCAHRLHKPAPPFLTSWAPTSPDPGDEIIVYWSDRLLGEDDFFRTLADIGPQVTVVAPAASAGQAARHAAPRLKVITQALDFGEIARRARLVISNGNTGFVSAAMLAGLPQSVLPHDIQKQLVGNALMRLGVGDCTPLDAVDWPAWSRQLQASLADDAMRSRARALSARLVPRMHQQPGDLCAAQLLRLAA